jgi:predicted RNA methylase
MSGSRGTRLAAPTKRVACSLEAEAVLRAATIDGNVLALPPGQLDRKLYVEVNKVLVALGGKWDRRVGGHVFNGSPAEALAAALDMGAVVSRNYGHFPTPAGLARAIVEEAGVEASHRVLEPSAGTGAIADVAAATGADLCLVEIQEPNCKLLREKGYDPICADFMDTQPGVFDRVVMNPPFERRQDIAHVTRAFSLLAPGGRLVAIMSAGSITDSTHAGLAFADLLQASGSHHPNDPDAFRESGTLVRTVTVVLSRE